MHLYHHGNVLLALAQWHKHPFTKNNTPFHPFGDRIGKHAR